MVIVMRRDASESGISYVVRPKPLGHLTVGFGSGCRGEIPLARWQRRIGGAILATVVDDVVGIA